MARFVAVAVGAALAFAAAGCGEETSTTTERLAASIQDVADDDIASGHAYSVLDVDCDSGDGGRYSCTVNIAVNPDAVQENFAVRLDDDCWVATRVSVERAAGRTLESDELPSSVLRGCLT